MLPIFSAFLNARFAKQILQLIITQAKCDEPIIDTRKWILTWPQIYIWAELYPAFRKMQICYVKRNSYFLLSALCLQNLQQTERNKILGGSIFRRGKKEDIYGIKCCERLYYGRNHSYITGQIHGNLSGVLN